MQLRVKHPKDVIYLDEKTYVDIVLFKEKGVSHPVLITALTFGSVTLIKIQKQ